MTLPPNDSAFWNIAAILAVGFVVLMCATFGTKNGFDWRTDIPALLAILAAQGAGMFAQSKAPKE